MSTISSLATAGLVDASGFPAPKDAAKVIRVQNRAQAGLRREDIAFRRSPTVWPVIKTAMQAWQVIGDRAKMNEQVDARLHQCEHLLLHLRKQSLFQSSFHPHSSMRMRLALDGYYLGVSAGLYYGTKAGYSIVHAIERLLIALPLGMCRYALRCASPLLRTPLTMLALALGLTQAEHDQLRAPDVTQRNLHERMGRKIRDGVQQTFQYAIVAACAVRRAASFVLIGAVASSITFIGAAVCFGFRVCLLSTIFSKPFADGIGALHHFLGHEYGAVKQCHDWVEKNERAFNVLPHGLGHSLEHESANLFRMYQFAALASTLAQALAFTEAPLLHNTKPQETQFLFKDYEGIIRELSHAQSQLYLSLIQIGDDYRRRCIRDFHVDPAAEVERRDGEDIDDACTRVEQESRAHINENLGNTLAHEDAWPNAQRWSVDDYFFFPEHYAVAATAVEHTRSRSLYATRVQQFRYTLQRAPWFNKLIPLPISIGPRAKINQVEARIDFSHEVAAIISRNLIEGRRLAEQMRSFRGQDRALKSWERTLLLFPLRQAHAELCEWRMRLNDLLPQVTDVLTDLMQ